jgi:hypothetical protein
MATYVFNLPFYFEPRVRIKSAEPQIELARTKEGQTIWLCSASGKPLRDSREARIVGREYASCGEARQAGGRVRQGIFLWALTQGIGVALGFGEGMGRSTLTDAGLEWLARETKCPVRRERPELDVYKYQKGLRLARIGFNATIEKDPLSFAQQVRTFMESSLEMSKKQSLAVELYCASLFDASSRSRFITLITAVEALLEQVRRPSEVQVLVDEMVTKAKSLRIEVSAKPVVISSIERLRNESIGEAGRLLVGRLLGDRQYGGMKAVSFFKVSYKLRSEIVHTGEPAERGVDLLELGAALHELVHDLLMADLNLPLNDRKRT